MASPKDTYTLEDYIIAGESVEITYNNLSFIEKINDTLSMPIFNVVDDYMAELKAMCMEVKFNEQEFIRYKYRPKILAHDLYMNSELYFLILKLNGMCDVKEFTKEKINLLPPKKLVDALNYIYNAERKVINTYNER